MTPRELEVLQEIRRWTDEHDVSRAIEHHVRAILERRESPSIPRSEVQRILGELAGFASLCWNPRPSGVFDSTLASDGVDRALAELFAERPDEEPRSTRWQQVHDVAPKAQR